MDARARSDEAQPTLATWLRAGRDRKKLTIEDVAKITKIQLRILEKLESGSLDGLPAEVFVKGFVRSYAKCVGLDESEALDKFSAAQSGSIGASSPVLATGSMSSMPTAQALVDTMAAPSLFAARKVEVASAPVADVEAPIVEAAPGEAPVIEVAVAVEAPTTSKKKNRGKKRATGSQRAKKKGAKAELQVQAIIDAVTPAGEPSEAPCEATVPTDEAIEVASVTIEMVEAANVLTAPEEAIEVASVTIETVEAANVRIDTAPVAKIDVASLDSPSIEAKTDDAIIVSDASIEIPVDGAVEAPSLAEGSQRISQPAIAIQDMIDAEPIDSTSTSGTWQPTMPPLTTSSVPWRRPSLPRQGRVARASVPTLLIDDADPDSADRERETRQDKEPARVSFLPPILLDREDRSARQGGLTLAVIILLIAATLTLSYLMRRPSPSGDGVTMLDTPSMLV